VSVNNLIDRNQFGVDLGKLFNRKWS
jgi:hypothetical protein